MPHYIPFPSFTAWKDQSTSLDTFDLYADRFRRLGEIQREQARIELTRSAAVDTNAIEGIYQSDRGFTRTIAEQAHGWEAAMANRGSHVRPAFDDAMAGYQYILDVATGRIELSEKLIRELHATITGSQETFEAHTVSGSQKQTLTKGVYKTQPNSPTRTDGSIHFYAPVEDTAPEMTRLVAECTSSSFTSVHPVLQASYIHYAFVAVHPFADGNGRVSRALASIYLYRDPGVPFLVFQDQRNSYYDCLEFADQGYYRQFIDFIRDRAIDAIMLAEQSYSPKVSAKDALASLTAEQDSKMKLQHFLPGALRVKDAAFSALTRCYEQLPGSGSLEFQSSPGLNGNAGKQAGYVYFPGPNLVFNQVGRARHENFIQVENFCVLIKEDSAQPGAEYVIIPSFAIPNQQEQSPVLEVLNREVEPTITESLRLRIESWAQAACDSFVAGVVDAYRRKSF